MRRLLPALAIVLAPAVAAGHVRITSPTPRSTSELKEQHCGAKGSLRANVHTVLPGSKLHLVWDEYVKHPGWFRISFQQNGDTFEIPEPVNKTGFPTEDLTGMIDPGNSARPSSGSLIIADRIMHPALSYDVQLPNVECNNCTLQLTQMMTDKQPYTDDLGSDDIYFACVDLVLSASAPDAGPIEGSGPDAGVSGGGGTQGGTQGGCSAAGGAPGLLVLGALALVLRRRRTVRVVSA
jgi:uncharacterized protein (TIGR03382 family)